jgi:outer membrane protein assembly factor BamA
VRNDSNYLDTRITLFPGNMHYMQFGVDGTNSAGDLGIASNVSYEHRNIFKGGETFRVRLNGAYEFIGSSDSLNLLDDSYYEYGADVFLSIPQLLLPWRLDRLRDQPSASTDFTAGINYQNRPEYLRQFFNLSSRFQWSSFDWKLQNVLEPLGITYVRMPRTSAQFDSLYMDEKVNPILRYSYDEQLIVRSAYHATFTNYSRIARRSMPTVPFRIRAGVEVAGWLPHLATSFGAGQRENGRKTFFKIPYSEYIKGDFDFAPMYVFDYKNTLAARVAIGAAYPYGNSIVLPFEKRYFGGGANSVRGWSTRSRGPGTYSRDSLGSDFGHRIGDVKLDLSLEFRRKMSSLIEFAGFIDAGNIWTIKDYEEQPGGLFRWDRFYKELAVAYGVGLRLDLNFLILRLDGGMKAHNPALVKGSRWTLFTPNLRRDFALHFAIGYPF